MKFLICLFVVIPVLLLQKKLSAQENQSDTIFYRSAVQNALAIYKQSAGDQSRLLNGREYKPYRISFVHGHPFFQSEKFAAGSITYEGGVYDQVQLLYDEVKELVILETGISIEMITERISQFTISGHTFIKLPADIHGNKPGEGFYEILYAGRIKVYKKEKKSIADDLSDTEGLRGDVSAKKYYYVEKEGQYYPVKKKYDIYEILPDRKKELQQFVKNNGLSFKNDKDNLLVKVAGYYDQLTR